MKTLMIAAVCGMLSLSGLAMAAEHGAAHASTKATTPVQTADASDNPCVMKKGELCPYMKKGEPCPMEQDASKPCPMMKAGEDCPMMRK